MSHFKSAPNSISAGALPQTPLGQLTAPLGPLAGFMDRGHFAAARGRIGKGGEGSGGGKEQGEEGSDQNGREEGSGKGTAGMEVTGEDMGWDWEEKEKRKGISRATAPNFNSRRRH